MMVGLVESEEMKHNFNCYGHRLAMSDVAAVYQFNRYHWKAVK
jgi:hypothetical protein